MVLSFLVVFLCQIVSLCDASHVTLYTNTFYSLPAERWMLASLFSLVDMFLSRLLQSYNVDVHIFFFPILRESSNIWCFGLQGNFLNMTAHWLLCHAGIATLRDFFLSPSSELITSQLFSEPGADSELYILYMGTLYGSVSHTELTKGSK